MAQWFAVYRPLDSELVSSGTVIADATTLTLNALVAKPIAQPPNGGVWNKVTLDFDPPPPGPTLHDLVQDMLADPRWPATISLKDLQTVQQIATDKLDGKGVRFYYA